MPSLEALAGWESAIAASIGGATGALHERDRQIERAGLYGEYPAIFEAYRDAMWAGPTPAVRMEALKRAVFLAWIAAVEPRCLTGVPDLPSPVVRNVFALLDTVLDRMRPDEELLWMVAWYVHREPAPFDVYGPVPALDRALAKLSPDAWRAIAPDSERFAGRGQLGRFWAALFETTERED